MSWVKFISSVKLWVTFTFQCIKKLTFKIKHDIIVRGIHFKCKASAKIICCSVNVLVCFSGLQKKVKMIVIDLTKQQALDADPRAIQQISFRANSDRVRNARIYFILEEAKETVIDFSQGTVKVL